MAALVAAAALFTSPVRAPAPVHAATADCVDGFSLVAPTAMIVPEDVQMLSPTRAFIAGGRPLSGGRRAARIVRYGSDGWRHVSTKTIGRDSGYVAIGGTGYSGYWAVGYVMGRTSLSPLIARRRAGGTWKRVATPRLRGPGATLTDVSAFKRRAGWAVGYRLGAAGVQQMYALRWNGRRWSAANPALRRKEQGELSGVSSDSQGGTWVAGSTRRYGATRPYIARRTLGTWDRMTLPGVGEAALSAISVPVADRGWAVGYRVNAEGSSPLVLRWDGSAWASVASPELPGEGVLLDVATDPSGAVTVVGSTWVPAAKRMRGFIARRDGGSWTVTIQGAMPGHAGLNAVDGDPMTSGLAAGRDLKSGVVVRTCESVGPATSSGRRSVRKQRRSAIRSASSASPETGEHLPEPEPAPRVGLAAVPRLEVAAAGNVRIRDRAKVSGLPTSAPTHGAVVRDFDKDGRPDIFLNGHSRPAKLFFDRGATYQRASTSFGWGDRHGCAAADVDGSGLPDLYCNFGGGRGLGVKGNQLWLDPGSASPSLAPDAGGAPEPLGRGREVIFLDVDDDGQKDLIVGQQQNRLDGLPTVNRAYLRTGPAEYEPVNHAGIAIGLGVTSFDSADVDRDGRVDLLLTYADPKASGTAAGTRLYRNTAGGFVDVTAGYGIRSIGDRDAELVRLDGDDRADLVQLSGNRIRVSLQRGGRFVPKFERKISNAVAVAAGDADGDGDMDLFVLRQKNTGSVNDLVLFNRGNGRSFRAVQAPSRFGGRADDVVAIDHDQNGLTDFLALNGGAGAGPLQLFAFYR